MTGQAFMWQESCCVKSCGCLSVHLMSCRLQRIYCNNRLSELRTEMGMLHELVDPCGSTCAQLQREMQRACAGGWVREMCHAFDSQKDGKHTCCLKGVRIDPTKSLQICFAMPYGSVLHILYNSIT